MKSQFVLEWEKALGWKNNPFQDKVFEPIEQFFAGYVKERQRMNLFIIENYKYGIVLGEDGTGKTALLRWMRGQLLKYPQKFSVLYLNSKNLSMGDFIRSLVTPFLNPIELYITRPWKNLHIGNVVEFLKARAGSKSIVILLDEAHLLSKGDLLILKHLFDSSLKVQLIVAGTPEEMRKSIISTFAEDQLEITLHGLKYDEVKEMLSMRIEALGGNGIEPFDDANLSHIVAAHQNNPKRILGLCNDHAIKLSLKHAFVKNKDHKEHHHIKEKMFVVENMSEEEVEKHEEEHPENKGITDIFIPGLLDEPRKKEEDENRPSHIGDIEQTDAIIMQAAQELKEAAKEAPKKKMFFGKKKK